MKRNIKNILLYVISVFIVGLIVMFIITETDPNKKNNSVEVMLPSEESIMIVSDEETEESTYAMNSMNECESTEEINIYEHWNIESLIKCYFDAISQCDVDMIYSIVDSHEKVSLEILNKKAQYIEKYTNFAYYLKYGFLDHTYVLYVVYDVQFKDVSVTAPAIQSFYIKENSDGVVYISRIPLEGASAMYISELEKQEEVVKLIESVEKQYQEVCSEDERMIELGDIMKESIWIHE